MLFALRGAGVVPAAAPLPTPVRPSGNCEGEAPAEPGVLEGKGPASALSQKFFRVGATGVSPVLPQRHGQDARGTLNYYCDRALGSFIWVAPILRIGLAQAIRDCWTQPARTSCALGRSSFENLGYPNNVIRTVLSHALKPSAPPLQEASDCTFSLDADVLHPRSRKPLS